MIPAATIKDREQLKAHALELLKKGWYEGLIILLEELQDTDFELPEGMEKNRLMWWASGHGYLKICKYLVEQKGVDPHADHEHYLRTASCKGHVELVKYLVERGADIHENNDEAFRLASAYSRKEVVEYLKSAIDK